MKKLLERIFFGPRAQGTPVPPPTFKSRYVEQPHFNQWAIGIRKAVDSHMRLKNI